MFTQLPEEIERKIWMTYFNYVLKDIRCSNSIWENPSLSLFVNTSDPGAIQFGYTELWRRYDRDMEPHCLILRWILNYPYGTSCEDCYFNKKGDCQQKKVDKEFEDFVQLFWR